MTAGDMRVVRRSVGDVEVVELHGEIDFASADEVREALCAAAGPLVIVDLGPIDFIDSAGLRALDTANRELHTAGRRLALVVSPTSRAAVTFRVAGFAGDAVHDSVESVLETVAGS
jgi:anti-anti-sigma factor